MNTQKMQDALNEQLNAEIFSSYLYLSLSGYAESVDMPGLASWFRVQAQEELVHAGKFFAFITDRNWRVRLTTIAAPEQEWSSPKAAFEAALKHEQLVTSLINKRLQLAKSEQDASTENFLQWFVAEQTEEEASFTKILGQLRLIGDNGGGLYMIDQELAKRVFVMPPTGPAAG